MSRRFVNTFSCFDALNSAVSQTSEPTNVEPFDSASYQIKFSAPSSGTFTIQARNGSKYRPDESELYWADLDFGAPLTITSESDVRILLADLTFSELRILWAPSSSSGTITSKLTMKAVGA